MKRPGFWSRAFSLASRNSRPASLVVGGLLLLLAATLDWATGPELASAIFYLLPIMWMTWKGGRWPGLGTALASGVIWLILLGLGHPKFAHEYIPVWNAFVRTTSFCVISSLQAEVLARVAAQRRLRQANADLVKQAGILQSILNSMGDGVLVADAQGQLLHINPAARRTLRLPPEERDVVPWFESIVNCLPNPLAANFSSENPLLRTLRGEPVDETEMLLPAREAAGETWLSVTGRPLREPGGRTVGGVIVFTDITARKSLERQIAEVSDREQRRLGEDLHDGLCQHLVSTAFAARRLAAKLGETSPTDAAEATEIAELLGAAIAQARDVARGLSLVPLESGGLSAALEEFAAQVRSRHDVACEFLEHGPVPDLDEPASTNLLRIAQEAVANALKHAQPRQIWLALSADAQQLRLEIHDDGTGWQQPSDSHRGMGLHMMNYRARVVGAHFGIGPRPGGGTTVTCSVRCPLPATDTLQPHPDYG
jgi:PAS domain S-box-containing protein